MALLIENEANPQTQPQTANPQTPPQTAFQHSAQIVSTPATFPGKLRRKKRRCLGITCIEGPRSTDEVSTQNLKPEKEANTGKRCAPKGPDEQRPKRRAKTSSVQEDDAGDDGEINYGKFPSEFSDDFFCLSGCRPPNKAALSLAASLPAQEAPAPGDEPNAAGSGGTHPWLLYLRQGFSVFVQGVGSKRQLLEDFASTVLLPWGATVVRIDGFNTRCSLLECLREVLEQVHPGSPNPGVSLESTAGAIRAARRSSTVPLRPLCFVVHNLEVLHHSQQVVLSTLAASPGVHLLASVDNIWTPLSWSPRCLKDFNICYQVAHSYDDYQVEINGRFHGSLPPWCNPNADHRQMPKISLGTIFRSLTNSHIELVQAMADKQRESGGKMGISMSALLTLATDKMIAGNVSKLRSLLNELRDHQVVVERCTRDGEKLYQLLCTDAMLNRLAEGQMPDESEPEDVPNEASSNAP